jgi:hypothetical protein
MLADRLRSIAILSNHYRSQMRRNQIVLSAVFVLTSIGVVGAQSAAPPPAARFGVVVGLNSSTMSSDDSKDASRSLA